MSERGGGNGPAYAVGLILGLSFFGLMLNNHQHDGSPTYIASQQENQKPPVFLAIPTSSSNPDPDRKEWREEIDLNAQRNMAQWAFWMFIVSGAGAIVGVLGLILIRQTLIATRHTNHNFRESSEKELRAYIGIEPIIEECSISVDLSSEQPTDADVSFLLKIKNYGQTPASNVLYTGQITWARHDQDFRAALSKNCFWKKCAPIGLPPDKWSRI